MHNWPQLLSENAAASRYFVKLSVVNFNKNNFMKLRVIQQRNAVWYKNAGNVLLLSSN